MENREVEIRKLFHGLFALTINEFKSKIDPKLFDLLIKIGYLSIDFETTGFFDVTKIDKLPEQAKKDLYFEDKTKEIEFFDEMYETDYGQYGWGYLFIKFNNQIYQILHGYDASA